MLFYSWKFISLFAVTLLVYWRLGAVRTRQWWLLFISYVFYGYWDVRFLMLLVMSSAIDFELGRAISRQEPGRTKRFYLWLSLVLNLGTLFTFKYFDFFSESFATAAAVLGLPYSAVTLNVVVPLGISFYTFHALSYIFDVYTGKIKPCQSRMEFMLYEAFFPQLLAGPIVRARDFLFQMGEKKYWVDVPWRSCLLLFVTGLIKKVCLGDNIAVFIDPVYQAPEDYSAASVLVAGFLFHFQVYLDFSGYTDMAIATARMMGFVIPVNFYFPFLAENIAEFWRRWHISLGAWFRDYVFLRMGGFSRRIFLSLRNVAVTMALIGLWHGAAFHYMLWGLWNGVGIWIYYVYRQLRGRYGFASRVMALPQWASLMLAVLFTDFVVSLGAILFRVNELPLAFSMIRQGVLLAPSGDKSIALPGIGAALVLLGMHWVQYRFRPTYYVQQLPLPVFAIIMGCLLAFYTLAMSTYIPPFIYFDY